MYVLTQVCNDPLFSVWLDNVTSLVIKVMLVVNKWIKPH